MHGLLSKYTLLSGSTVMMDHTYKYDVWGNVSEDDILQGTNNIAIKYSYDWLNHQVGMSISSDGENKNNPNLNVVKSYTYNSLNQLLSSSAEYSPSYRKLCL
jgi:predicted porin